MNGKDIYLRFYGHYYCTWTIIWLNCTNEDGMIRTTFNNIILCSVWPWFYVYMNSVFPLLCLVIRPFSRSCIYINIIIVLQVLHSASNSKTWAMSIQCHDFDYSIANITVKINGKFIYFLLRIYLYIFDRKKQIVWGL